VVNQPARSSYQNVNTLAYGFFLSSPVGPAIDAGAADTGVIADAPELLINLNGQFPGWSQYKRADTGFGIGADLLNKRDGEGRSFSGSGLS